MKLNNPMTLYMASVGILYEVTHVCQDITVANAYCKDHSDSAVIAEDDNGNIFIAKTKPSFIKFFS
mgnify:CR=1 FL=1